MSKKDKPIKTIGLGSHEIFSKYMKKYDNSMGDHNHIPFDFIDKHGLDRQFADYMTLWSQDRLDDHIYNPECKCGQPATGPDYKECFKCWRRHEG